MKEQNRTPVIALVATPHFKDKKIAELRRFVYEHFYTLVTHFKVISTGNTHSRICDLMKSSHANINKNGEIRWIATDFGRPIPNDRVLGEWRQSAMNKEKFEQKSVGLVGMIEIASELVEGRIDAVIQLSVEDDLILRAGSAVLQRQAIVHNVPIAGDVTLAHSFVNTWKKNIRITKPLNPSNNDTILFSDRDACSPFSRLKEVNGDRVLAIISHDGRKNEISRFVVENADKLKKFDYILATRNSGELVKGFLRSAGWQQEELARVLPCKSGPEGGDVQIAAAVVQGLCRSVIFFQDPATSHAHHADIKLFEQAILEGTDVRLALNAASARILLASID